MRISDWSSDVCSSDLRESNPRVQLGKLTSYHYIIPATAVDYHGRRPLRNREAASGPRWRRRSSGRARRFCMPLAVGMTEIAFEIGRASCRERVCQVRVDLGGRGSLKKKKQHKA